MLIDYHLHNHFSPDSEEDTRKIVEKALEMGMKDICITNHPELHDKKTGEDHFNANEAKERFKNIKAELDEVQRDFPEVKLGFGMEMGYHEKWISELEKLVQETEFDFVLGSIHVVNDVIISSHLYAEELYSQTDEETAYSAYFDNMLKLVEWGQFDVVAHFDINKKFGYKFYGPFQPEKYKYRIMPILKRMKEKGIGLEINTKCMKIKCKEIFPHPTILRWAVEIGIENFTLGSDAHTEADVSQNIKEALEIAKEAGIRNISTYYKRTPTLHSV
jgi:histidinol-phosphatase (PHP family)